MKHFVLIVTIMFLFLGCDESESKPDKDSDAVINNADSENDEDLQNALVESGDRTNQRLWNMPMWDIWNDDIQVHALLLYRHVFYHGL